MPIARRWTEIYLTPYCTVTTERPDAEYLALFLPDESEIDIELPDQAPVPIDLHDGKQGLRWDSSTGRTLIRERERGDWYSIDQLASQVPYIAAASAPDAYRDPARIVREMMLSRLVGQVSLPLHGSAAALYGEPYI